MAIRSMKLALLALVAILVCSVYAQATEKSAARIDVGSLSTQEIEEQLQVRLMNCLKQIKESTNPMHSLARL